MFQKIERIMGWLYKAIGGLTFVAFLIMVLIVLVQIFFRYVLSSSLAWSEETARYLAIVITFLAIGLAFSRGELIGIDIVIRKLQPRAQMITETISHISILIFLFYLTKYGWKLAVFSRGQVSSSLRIPMNYIYGVIPVGAAIMGLFVIWALVRMWWLKQVEIDKQCS